MTDEEYYDEDFVPMTDDQIREAYNRYPRDKRVVIEVLALANEYTEAHIRKIVGEERKTSYGS